MADGAANIGFSRFRGERLELGDGIVLVNDCYNANPVSMRAALDHLGTLGAERTIAVLGEMAELGPGAPAYHREVGEHARAAGVDLLVGVGEPARDYDPDELVGDAEEAAELLAAQLGPGDAVLVKGSRSAGLEAVAEACVDGAESSMGEVLIAGMAAMLICIFLGPKFIEYLRVKEFGQHIREDGPQEHHAKAGRRRWAG